ncbi:unnamed protein product [Peronospora destructor]|uniref:Uncharacterized protein n=1 Tax=Peronospora destructor TaxID=86335 RepID=A0AAV0T5N3_9STRA|nr:unnamed protein product [Peronospora destructor]
MDLPGIPSAAWDAIKHAIEPRLVSSRAKDAVFPASRELWRFVLSTTLHAIWTERLRRMEDSSLPQEPGMEEGGHLFARVQSALADTLLCCDEPTPLASAAGRQHFWRLLPAFLRRGVTRKSSWIRHRPTTSSDARCMRFVGIEHGVRFCRNH